MYNNKRKAKPLTRIKHSKFIDEDPNIDDICTRIQSTTKERTQQLQRKTLLNVPLIKATIPL